MNRIQAAKDSLYVALRDRLESINPARIAEIGGATRIAIALEGPLLAESERNLAEVFYLSFGAIEVVPDAAPPSHELLKVACAVRYGVEVSEQREFKSAEMDSELMQAMNPQWAEIEDYSGESPVSLGGRTFWSMPKVAEKDGVKTAAFSLFVMR